MVQLSGSRPREAHASGSPRYGPPAARAPVAGADRTRSGPQAPVVSGSTSYVRGQAEHAGVLLELREDLLDFLSLSTGAYSDGRITGDASACSSCTSIPTSSEGVRNFTRSP